MERGDHAKAADRGTRQVDGVEAPDLRREPRECQTNENSAEDKGYRYADERQNHRQHGDVRAGQIERDVQEDHDRHINRQ